MKQKVHTKSKDLDKIVESDLSPIAEVEGEKYADLQIIALDSKSFEKYAKEIKVNYNDVKETGILCDEYQVYDEDAGNHKELRRYKYVKRKYNRR